ncbi:MAG TPA: N-acyl-D-glucosamine 2-epimerase, partial [Pseudonocardiaceae bacterium]
MSSNLTHTWADTIAGYVQGFNAEARTFELKTSDGRSFTIELDETTGAELLRNLGEPYTDGSGHLDDVLVTGRYVIVYGIFYPDGEKMRYTAKHIELVGRSGGDYGFEEPTWWIKQIDQLASFYRRAQFGNREVDYRDYRTELHLGGSKTQSHVQETDTISRMVYGMASA